MSATLAMEAIAEAEAMGVRLRLNDGKIKLNYAAGKESSVALVIERLKANRDQVAEALRQRSEIPPMPPGVRLLSWEPKRPPVVLEKWSVVTDVPLFARRTLEQLKAALDGKNWLAGNWSARDLIERLELVGMKVVLEDAVQVLDCGSGTP